MKILSRKTLASMVAGTFIMAGVAAPFTVQAAEAGSQQPPSFQQQKCQKDQKGPRAHNVNPEKAAQRLADAFGINQTMVMAYHTNGMDFRDIGHAAFLANASGKTLGEVISYKTADNNWRDIAKDMGITHEQMKAARQNIAANRLNKTIGLDKTVSLDLLHQGYRSRDIGMAAQLAKNTSKPITEVLSMRKINNTWLDVATTLGVDKETFKKDMQKLGYGHHRGHYSGHGGGHGERFEMK